MAEVNQGDVVRKSGRTSGVTTGEIVHTNASVSVEYTQGEPYIMLIPLSMLHDFLLK